MPGSRLALSAAVEAAFATEDAGPRDLERSALLAGLDRARGGRVTVLQAPAGYGKSQLLMSWSRRLRRQGVAVAWPDLDEELADPARFLAALILAVAEATSADPPIAAAALPITAPRLAAKRLGALLQACPTPLVIIIDDYDCTSGDELDAIVVTLIGNLPSQVHCVLVSRQKVRIPFGALWCESNVALFGQRELRLSDSEIAEMFDHRLSAEDLARISVWTEGWPVAVQLVRHTLFGRADADRGLDTLLSRVDGDISRYLMEQVLQSLPERDREMLVRSSFLSELRADLVEAVTGIAPAWQILQTLQNSNVLIAPVDDAEGWFRCHHLLRDVLFGQLRQRGTAELARLQATAARWFCANGQLRESLRHAKAAGDFDFAAQLIQDAGGIFYGIRYGAPALRLLMDHLPPEIISEYPRLSLAHMLILAKEGRFDIGADIVRIVKLRYKELLSRNRQTVDPLLVQDIAMAELVLTMYVGLQLTSSAAAVIESVARKASAEAFWLRGVHYNLLCMNKHRASDFPAALAAADSALYYYTEGRSSNGIGHMHLHIGRARLEQGDPVTAQAHCNAGRTTFENGLCGDDSGCAMADVLAAEALYEQGLVDDARALCAPALELGEAGESDYEMLVSGYRTQTALVAAEQGPQAAMRLLARGLARARQRRFVEVERYLTLLRQERQLEVGEYSDLAAGVDALPGGMQRGRRGRSVSCWREQDLRELLSARLALQRGERRQAIDALERHQAQLADCGRVRNQVRALVHLCLAYHADGARADALARLHSAIALSWSGGLIMPFVEQGRGIMPLMAQLVTTSGLRSADPSQWGFINRVLQIGSQLGAAAISVFSQREQEIVQLLVQGTNNKLIARSLGVSPETVRFHLKNIYEKFGVSDRRVVAALAGELGLLG